MGSLKAFPPKQATEDPCDADGANDRLIACALMSTALSFGKISTLSMAFVT
jgi:hypothetical protein